MNPANNLDHTTNPVTSALHSAPEDAANPTALEDDAEDHAPARREPLFSGAWWSSAGLWRTLTFMGLLVSLLGAGTWVSMYGMMNSHIGDLSKRLSKVRHVAQVAVLTGTQGEAAMLVTLGSGQAALKVQRVGSYAEATDRSLQLWALPKAGAPRSLGVLTPGQAVQRLEAEPSALQGVASLAISLEPAGGVRQPEATPGSTTRVAGPTGPVLFKGQLLTNL